jgi:hypothetical protein
MTNERVIDAKQRKEVNERRGKQSSLKGSNAVW